MGGCCESDKGNQEAYLMYSGNLQGIKPANKKHDRFEERKYYQQKIDLENSSQQQADIEKFIQRHKIQNLIFQGNGGLYESY